MSIADALTPLVLSAQSGGPCFGYMVTPILMDRAKGRDLSTDVSMGIQTRRRSPNFHQAKSLDQEGLPPSLPWEAASSELGPGEV